MLVFDWDLGLEENYGHGRTNPTAGTSQSFGLVFLKYKKS